ncbi:hypothetical protein ACH4S8_44385 [Streptomyces sp. NPDC021080]|uniref:hypothetical protein n=1 Tax=Streptomyces sp. NPDC021080 TaxID=3365110 RepID=UPI0037BA8AFE
MRDRLYQLWITHAGEPRHELGEIQAQNMLREAHHAALPGRRAVLLTLRRPAVSPTAAGVADRMTGPEHLGASAACSEGTPQ